MTTAKNLGIWMDHSSAHLIEFTNNLLATQTVDTKFAHKVRHDNLTDHKEQQQRSGYYKQLCVIIKDYERVVLFGNTEAKTELYNILRADHRFAKITINVVQTDNLNDNQQHAFVRSHFLMP